MNGHGELPRDSAAASPAAVDETLRQQALDRSGIRSRRGDSRLEEIVLAAARHYTTQIALVSIIDRQSQWFAARTGLSMEGTPREHSFCLHAMVRPGEPMIVLDAMSDRRFTTNPLVTGEPFLRFYAGVPLLERAGYPVGALCVIDPSPRHEAPSMFQLIRLARDVEKAAGW